MLAPIPVLEDFNAAPVVKSCPARRRGFRSVPGMVASLQTYGDDPSRFHPHLYGLVSDGLVSPDGSFIPIPCPDPVSIMHLFRHKLVTALLAREKISPRLVEIMSGWVHPGFFSIPGKADRSR